jgi:hypothetical protein
MTGFIDHLWQPAIVAGAIALLAAAPAPRNEWDASPRHLVRFTTGADAGHTVTPAETADRLRMRLADCDRVERPGPRDVAPQKLLHFGASRPSEY